jgi:hypothetical protein
MNSNRAQSGYSFEESFSDFHPIGMGRRAMLEGEGYSVAISGQSGLCDASEELCVATGRTE